MATQIDSAEEQIDLVELRLIKRLRTGGSSFTAIAKAIGISSPTAKKRWKQAIKLMQAGRLHEDVDKIKNADTWYRSP